MAEYLTPPCSFTIPKALRCTFTNLPIYLPDVGYF